MRKERTSGGIALMLGLALAASAGCDREKVDEGVREVKETTHEVASEVKEQAANARVEAERLRERLPELREEAKENFAEARDDVKDVLHTAGEKVKAGAREARDALDMDEPKSE